MRDSLAAQVSLFNELLSSAMDPELEKLGITPSTFELLSAIRGAGGRGTQVEVARRLGITAPSLSEAVSHAVARGLVEQKLGVRDKRSKVLILSPTGKQAVERVLKGVNLAEQKMVEGVDHDELNAAVEVLKKVNRNLARSLQDE